MTVIYPYIGGGDTESLWSPHWGIDLESYATAGKIAILVHESMPCSFKVSTDGGADYRVTTYEDGTSSYEDVADNTAHDWDYTDFSAPFSDPDSMNGYGTYVIVISATSGNIDSFEFELPSGASAQTVCGQLWLVCNADVNVKAYMLQGLTEYLSMNIECVQMLDGKIGQSQFAGNATLNFNNLKKVEADTYNGANRCYGTFANQTALIAVSDFPKDQTNYSYMFSACYRANNDVSGTYSSATTMLAMLDYNYSRVRPVEIDAPVCTSFGGFRYMVSLRELTFVRARLYAGSGTVADFYRCYNLNTQDTIDTLGKALIWTYVTENEATIQSTYPAFDASVYETWDEQDIYDDLTTNYSSYTAWQTAGSGKTIRITNCPDAATVDGTPVTDMGFTLTR